MLIIYAFLFKNNMIRLWIGLEIRHRGVMSLYATEDKTAVVVVALHRNVSRNSVRFKALTFTVCVESVPLYHFKLAYVVLHVAGRKLFEIRF